MKKLPDVDGYMTRLAQRLRLANNMPPLDVLPRLLLGFAKQEEGLQLVKTKRSILRPEGQVPIGVVECEFTFTRPGSNSPPKVISHIYSNTFLREAGRIASQPTALAQGNSKQRFVHHPHHAQPMA